MTGLLLFLGSSLTEAGRVVVSQLLLGPYRWVNTQGLVACEPAGFYQYEEEALGVLIIKVACSVGWTGFSDSLVPERLGVP